MNQRPTHVADESEQPQKHQDSANCPPHDVSSIDPASRSRRRSTRLSPASGSRLKLSPAASAGRRECPYPSLACSTGKQW
jgi:hypothetical protein